MIHSYKGIFILANDLKSMNLQSFAMLSVMEGEFPSPHTEKLKNYYH